MYVPNHFKEDDTKTLHQHIRDHSFGLLIVADEQGIEANHVPFHICCDENEPLGALQCQVARKNPVWQRLQTAENKAGFKAGLAAAEGPQDHAMAKLIT